MQPNITDMQSASAILARLQTLEPEQRLEVRDFIEFLLAKKEHHSDAKSAMAASESVAARYWDNEDDAGYDKL